MHTKTGRAWFVYLPERIEDLRRPHMPEQEHPYAIVKRISLARIDYENFITDMVADRQFIEDNASLCSMGDVYRCLLVRQDGMDDGVLVLPYDASFVQYAAYYAAPAE